MEEAELIKERLQSITEKRRIQESIAKKRRQIEEEKLKLQYIKKKTLREQWLMDGLSQQSEQEEEAMRLQAQDEQQQRDQLQTNILRIEKEIEALEAQELSISANEEVILKRLKEVERTAEDIIKELNAEVKKDVTCPITSPLPCIPSFIPPAPAKPSPVRDTGSDELKKAMFAMEINVEHDNRTGKSQVISTATIAPETLQHKGLKVYDDGHKSVYALELDGGKTLSRAGSGMTPTEVDELIHQATDKNLPEVQYHEPVYAVPYRGMSRPSTPKILNQISPRPTPSSFLGEISSRDGAIINREKKQTSQDLEGWTKTNHSLIQKRTTSGIQIEATKLPFSHVAGQSSSGTPPILHPNPKTPQICANIKTNVNNPKPAVLVPVTARPEANSASLQLVGKTVDRYSPSLVSNKSKLEPDVSIENSDDVPLCAERITSINLVKSLPEEHKLEPVTMLFMGYENAEEKEDVRAQLVIVGSGNDDDDKAQGGRNETNAEECLSYHPEGYKSKVFQPEVCIAKVTGSLQDELILQPGENSTYLRGHRVQEHASTGSINMEKYTLCSTGR